MKCTVPGVPVYCAMYFVCGCAICGVQTSTVLQANAVASSTMALGRDTVLASLQHVRLLAGVVASFLVRTYPHPLETFGLESYQPMCPNMA